MRNEEKQGFSTFALPQFIERLGPTPDVRRRAWREFQRALDPLARPRPLPRARF